MREVAGKKSQLCRFIELHEYLVTLTHVFFVHSDPFEQLKLQLLVNCDPEKQHFIITVLPNQLLLYLFHTRNPIAELMAGYQLYLVYKNFQNFNKFLRIVLYNGGFFLTGGNHSNCSYFLDDFMSHGSTGLIFMTFPSITYTKFTTFPAYIPFI